MDDEDSAYENGVNGSVSNGQYPPYDDAMRESPEVLAARRRDKAKVARPLVEDFPMPPGATATSPSACRTRSCADSTS